MILKRLFAAMGALALGTTAATAADVLPPTPIITYTPPPVMYTPPSNPWAGFHIGVIGGFTWGEADVVFAEDPTIEFRGPEVGILAGFNVQRGRFVLGLEGDIMRSFEQGVLEYADWTEWCLEYEMQDSVRINWVATARVRAGFTLGEEQRLLVYGTVGFAVGNLSANRTITATNKWGDTWIDYENDFTLRGTGLTFGAGAEVRLGERVTLGVEYRQTRLTGMNDTTGNSITLVDHGIFGRLTFNF